MAGPTPRWDIPNPTTRAKYEDLDSMRDDLWPALIMGALISNQIISNWYLTGTTLDSADRPLQRIFQWTPPVGNPVKARIDYTYTGDFPATVTCYWDRGLGAGYELFVPGTATISYDGEGNIESVIWS